MPTALEKARQAPDSMKARILSAARKRFGEYGYHGVTTRMIAQEVGIDISTLHYHWGEKQDLYEAVLTDLSDEIHAKLIEIEGLVHGKPLEVRLEVAIDVMCDHLFGNPDSAHLMLFSHFSKNRITSELDAHISRHLANIAVAMGLAAGQGPCAAPGQRPGAGGVELGDQFRGRRRSLPAHTESWTAQAYLAVVKETLKFILLPAFTRQAPRE